jgi:hypothetical protein
MELGENQNLTKPQEGTPSPNPPPTNVNTKIDEGLNFLRFIVQDLWTTREPTRLKLTTSLDNIISPIGSAQGKLTNIHDYSTRMFEYYRIVIDKTQVRELNITKQELMSLFIESRTGLQPPFTKRNICMDWCIHQKFKDNWMDRCFMMFDKNPWNNREVPLYFLRKLWA